MLTVLYMRQHKSTRLSLLIHGGT
eukprot:SAG31_NODE_44229_length_263_cov_1.268293_1_plen_23_part_01